VALGLVACQKGFRVQFTTASSLAHELIEAKDERRLMRFQKMLSSFELLIIDELGFVPLSKTGAGLLFQVFSRRYEGSATLVTSNLPFNEWTEAFGSEQLTGALLDRLTHRPHPGDERGGLPDFAEYFFCFCALCLQDCFLAAFL
jgi:DNA replication protein DnaC